MGQKGPRAKAELQIARPQPSPSCPTHVSHSKPAARSQACQKRHAHGGLSALEKPSAQPHLPGLRSRPARPIRGSPGNAGEARIPAHGRGTFGPRQRWPDEQATLGAFPKEMPSGLLYPPRKALRVKKLHVGLATSVHMQVLLIATNVASSACGHIPEREMPTGRRVFGVSAQIITQRALH